jgi:hypothetical protein
MKRLALLAILVASPAAQAAPITLICNGSITFKGHDPQTIDRETALVDLENKTFKPPMYAAFPITRVSDSDFSFGSESPTLSAWGSLDRGFWHPKYERYGAGREKEDAGGRDSSFFSLAVWQMRARPKDVLTRRAGAHLPGVGVQVAPCPVIVGRGAIRICGVRRRDIGTVAAGIARNSVTARI